MTSRRFLGLNGTLVETGEVKEFPSGARLLVLLVRKKDGDIVSCRVWNEQIETAKMLKLNHRVFFEGKDDLEGFTVRNIFLEGGRRSADPVVQWYGSRAKFEELKALGEENKRLAGLVKVKKSQGCAWIREDEAVHYLGTTWAKIDLVCELLGTAYVSQILKTKLAGTSMTSRKFPASYKAALSELLAEALNDGTTGREKEESDRNGSGEPESFPIIGSGASNSSENCP